MLSRALLPASIVTLVAAGSAQAAPRIALEGAGVNADDTYLDIQILLEDEGYEVDIVTGDAIDTLAEIEVYDAVLLGDSGSGDNDWSTFDSVLDDYVDGGGGLMGAGWVAYFVGSSGATTLADLLPTEASTSYEDSPTISASGSHELTDGWTAFTSVTYSNHGGGTKSGADVAATTSGGNDAIAYWEVGDGRVLHHSGNYLVSTGYYAHDALYDGTDAEALQSFLNAVSWVSGGECSTAPMIALEGAGINADDTYPEIQALLEDLGWDVDIVVAADIDEASEIAVYDAIFLGDSGYGDHDWADFEDVLLDYVDAGGGLLGSGWWPYFLSIGSLPDMEALCPVEPSTTWVEDLVVTADGTHELTDDWTSFTAPAHLNYGAGVKTGAEVAAYDSDGNPAVVYWNYGDGRVVHLSANYLVSSLTYGHEALWDGSEPDAWQSFVNAAEWVSNACSEIDPDVDEDLDDDGFPASEDCDDDDASVNPDAEEVCDGIDNDCDDTIDIDASDMGTWYDDNDEDGYGDGTVSVVQCDAPAGYVANDGDCDDTEPLAWTGAVEVCDDVDNDCDGFVDNDAFDAGTWYADNDEDGFGDPLDSVEDCSPPDGYVGNDADCDDTEGLAWTGAAEVCDGIDNDCDGLADNDPVDGSTWFADFDDDGYGDPGVTVDACDMPDDFVDNDGDCDDTEALAWTGAAEVCDDVDNDCDGGVDNDAIDAATWYADGDGDGFTLSDDSVQDCSPPDGYATASVEDDCDDIDPTVYPGATEIEDDGIDQDCDGEDATGGTTGDGGATDGGATDGGTSDGGTSDGGTSDGGTSDGGTSDGGTSDGGTSDGGTSDGGTSDGGSDDDKDEGCGGCASATSGPAFAWALPFLGLLLLRRRRA